MPSREARADTEERSMSYEDEILAFRARRREELLREDGFLAQVALDWLEEGENEVRGGRAVRRGHKVRLILPADGLDLELAIGDKVKVGRRTYEVLARGPRMGLRERDPESPYRHEFRGPSYFPIRPEWRLLGTFEPYDPPRQVELDYSTGFTGEWTCPGRVSFEVAGQIHRLEPIAEPGGKHLHFIFGDLTNGKETYGAGRFLFTPLPQDGLVVLDFNRAVNPPCAYSPFSTCPLPPPANRLPLRIEAGETYGDRPAGENTW